MDNNELLIQIEKLLDCKLEGRFDSLEGRLDSLEEKFDSLEGRFNSLEGRFNSLELKVHSIDDRLIAVEGDIPYQENLPPCGERDHSKAGCPL